MRVQGVGFRVRGWGWTRQPASPEPPGTAPAAIALPKSIMMSGLDGSGAVHAALTWGAFGCHVPSGGSEMYWCDQSIPRMMF